MFGLALAGLTACGTSELTPDNVLAFVDKADNAARKRFGPDICELRGRNFVSRDVVYAVGKANPETVTSDRKEYCMAVAWLPRDTAYVVERESIDIVIAPDARTAVVTADYVEKMPFYDPKTKHATIDDYDEVQIFETRDTSTVGIEDGRIVFLDTSATIRQTLHPRAEVPLPRP